MGATPTPWRKDMKSFDLGDGDDKQYMRSVVGPDNRTIVLTGFAISGGNAGMETSQANTDLVVTAVNAHSDLVAALKDAREQLQEAVDYWDKSSKPGLFVSNSLGTLDRIDAAIAKATR